MGEVESVRRIEGKMSEREKSCMAKERRKENVWSQKGCWSISESSMAADKAE